MKGFWNAIKRFFGFEKSELVKKLDQLQANAQAEHDRKIEQMIADGKKEVLRIIEDKIIPALYRQAETIDAKREWSCYCNRLLAVDRGYVCDELEKFLFEELKKNGISVKKKKDEWGDYEYHLRW